MRNIQQNLVKMAAFFCAASAVFGAATGCPAGDWPMWGGTPSRGMAADEKGLPADPDPGQKQSNGQFDPATARNLKWAFRLGTITCGSPVIADGKVFVGTNNGSLGTSRFRGDYGILLCLNEATGKGVWQLAVPGVPHMFYPQLGICSTPAIEGNRLYLVTNRCEVLCLDANGMADGNDGPFRDEGNYFAMPASQKLGSSVVRDSDTFHLAFGKPALEVKPPHRPVELAATDADVIWRYDLMNDLSVWPHDGAASSILIHGDYLFVCTGNGTDNTHRNVPSPQAPTFVAIHKKTGALAAVDDAQIGPRILEGTWSSPTLAKVGSRTLVILGGPDGVCYAFDASIPNPSKETPNPKLQTAWWYDCNPEAARFKDRAKVNYPSRAGPSEIISTPVFYKDRVYAAIGQDTRHGDAPGLLSCIDATGSGNLTDKAKVWQYDKISRTLSTPSIADGLLYIADVAGRIHCLDADTGRALWVCETQSLICGSTLVADGKVYIGTDKGDLWVLDAHATMKVLHKVNLGSAIYTTPVAANGVLYVASSMNLFAFQKR